MANKFTYQVLRDTQTDSVIKLTGVFDGASGNELNCARIAANTLSNALDANGALLYTSSSISNTALSYYDLQVTGVKYYVNFPTTNVGGVELFWAGAGNSDAARYANSATIFHLNLQGEFGLGEQLPSILNNSGYPITGIANTTGNGNLGIQTSGVVANAAYTLIVTLRKNNAMYQRGQFSDPAAFNSPPYGITP
jgi:hypothetical protein